MEATASRISAGLREGLVSIIANVALFALKMWASLATGSIALAADAWHTLSDSLSSIVVVAATKLASKKADREHPFGHGRIEQVASLAIAMILGVVAYTFLRDSVVQLYHKHPVAYGTIAIAATVASIAVKEALAQYAFRIARRTGNLAVKADGWHHRSDALSSVVVLAGILFARRLWWIDSVLGIAIALMLLYATGVIAKSAVNKILGEEPSPTLVGELADAIKTVYDEDVQLHHLHIHNYIFHTELTLHIRLNKDLTIEHGHRIATAIENVIRDKFGMVATVHVEPKR